MTAQEQIAKDPHDHDSHYTKVKITLASQAGRKGKRGMPDFLTVTEDGCLAPVRDEPARALVGPAPASQTSKEPPQTSSMELDRPGPADVSAADGPAGPIEGPGRPTAPSLPGQTASVAGIRQGMKDGTIQSLPTAVALTGSLGMQPGQRGATEKMQKSGSAVLAEKLGPQLGTAPEYLAHMQIDERKLAILNDLTSTSLTYLRFRAWVDRVRFWQWFVDGELVSSQAVGGVARRHILKALEAGQGAQVKEVQRPGLLARNIWAREWQRKAEMRGQMIPEADEEY